MQDFVKFIESHKWRPPSLPLNKRVRGVELKLDKKLSDTFKETCKIHRSRLGSLELSEKEVKLQKDHLTKTLKDFTDGNFKQIQKDLSIRGLVNTSKKDYGA